jgi:hypothetical protein
VPTSPRTCTPVRPSRAGGRGTGERLQVSCRAAGGCGGRTVARVEDRTVPRRLRYVAEVVGPAVVAMARPLPRPSSMSSYTSPPCPRPRSTRCGERRAGRLAS